MDTLESAAHATISQTGSQFCIQWPSRPNQFFDLELIALSHPEVVWSSTSSMSSFQSSTSELGPYRFRFTDELGTTNEVFFMRQVDYRSDRSGTTLEPRTNQPAGFVNFVVGTHPMDSYYRIVVRTNDEEELFVLETSNHSIKQFLEPGQYRWSVRPIRQSPLGDIEGRRSPWKSFSVEENTDLSNLDRDIVLVKNSIRGIALSPKDSSNTNLRFEIESPPEHGTLWGSKTEYLSYQPNLEYVGQDQAEVRVYDGDRASAVATLVFSITEPLDPVRSHFVPGIGTINFSSGTPGPPVLSGSPLPQAIAVVSGIAQIIDAIDTNGSILWRYQKENTWDAIAVCNDVLLFDDENTIYWIDSNSGRLLHTEQTDSKLLFANPSPQGLLIGEWTSDDNHHIAMYWPNTGVIWRLSQSFYFPRWADIHENLVVVANTFNLKVVGVDHQLDQIVFSEDVYFANDVRFLSPDSLLIVEEHADRVWTYNLSQKSRKWILGASNGLEDVDLSIDLLVDLTQTLRVDPNDDTSYSKSWRGFAGIQTLYAPNGAIAVPGGGYLVADTDNHRVVYANDQGQIETEITGFNNPNKVSLLTGSKQLPDAICHPER